MSAILVKNHANGVPTETDAEAALRSSLENVRDQVRGLKGGYHYKGPMDFVLREGSFFKIRPLPHNMVRRTVSECFKNAALTAIKNNIDYVEGYAVYNGRSFPVRHAWNVDADGFVVDTTWRPVGIAYLGVKIPIGESLRTIEAQMLGAVIDNWEQGWPLLREPWRPENPYV